MKRSTLLLAVATLLLSLGFTASENDVAKIYVYGDLLIRSNTAAGRIDFFDLREPTLLPKQATLRVDQNNDVAVVGDIMYADAGQDLIVFDISDIGSIRAIDTISGVFHQIYRFEESTPMPMNEEVGGMSGCGGCGMDSPTEAPVALRADASAGIAGSLARFAVAGNHLYCIDYSELVIFDVEMPRRPQLKGRRSIAWDMETLFPYGSTLFVGGQRGVYLVDITDGDSPRPISQFEHGRGCDPVVVENGRAYVTLRSGSPCGEVEDQLHVLDVSNLQHPILLKSIDVEGPYGLAVRDGIVYLCDGSAGLKIIDTRDLSNPRTVGTISGITAHDAILLDRRLIVTTPGEAIVYDLTDPQSPVRQGAISMRE